MKLYEIIDLLNNEVKLKNPESWDNSGLQIGNEFDDISKIMLTLDLDKDALNYAIDNNVNLIITHHPFIFSPIKYIDFNTYDGQIIKSLIMNNINLYSIHTSFDMADFGVNFQLSQTLNFDSYEILHPVNIDRSGYGGIANINPIHILDFAKHVKNSLNCTSIKLFLNDKDKIIKRVAFCGGSGSDFLYDAINKGADVYITGDIKYHQAQEALKNNLFIIDAGHYYTEYLSLKKLQKVLDSSKMVDVILLERNSVNEIVL